MADTATLANRSTVGMMNTTISPPEMFHHVGGVAYDFHQMAVVDWDEVHDGDKLIPRAYTSWNALNIIRLTLATWILASHIAIIVFILAKRVLRCQPKNLLIVNVALANLLMGVFVVPVKLHFILNPAVVQCDLAIGWTFISDYYQPSVSLFAVLSLVFERFIYVYTEKKQKNIKPWAERVGTVVLLVSPWILSCLFLMPTFFRAMLAESKNPNDCLYKVDDGYFLASQLISFIPPSLGVFLLAPFTGLLDCLRPKRCYYRPLTPKGESMTVTAFVSLFSIFSEAPYCVVRILMMRMECNNPYCTRFSETLTMTIWIRICKAAIFPFIWLAYTDIRNAMLCQVGTAKKSDIEDDDDIEEDDEEGHRLYPMKVSSSSKAI